MHNIPFIFVLAILAKVKTRMGRPISSNYLLNFQIETKIVFHQNKTINMFRKGRITVVNTPISMALCSARVLKNSVYILGGSIKGIKITKTKTIYTAFYNLVWIV